MDQIDRNLILAVVAEHYIDDDARLRQAKIMRQDKRPANLEPITHNEWRLWYDEKRNVVYL